MYSKNVALIIALSSLVFSTGAYAPTNDGYSRPTKPKQNVNVNIQSDTHHGYQSEVRYSGPQNDDGSIMTDEQIQNEAIDLIKNHYRKYNINITVSQGNVTLRGFVENDEAKQNIGRDIANIQGVKNVNNSINVK